MRKIVLALALCSLFMVDTNTVSAQTYEKGSKVLNLGISLFGRTGLGIGANGSFEVGMWPTGDFGVIGIGGIVGFHISSYGAVLGVSGYNAFDIGFAPRGTYHFTIIPVENLDVYGAVGINFRNTSYTYDGNSSLDYNDFDVFPSVTAGIRYYFSEKFGIFAEAGYDIAAIKGGVALQF
ncbi:MAG: hypothetical protein R2879_20740 [Saprospiraceae bacterium]